MQMTDYHLTPFFVRRCIFHNKCMQINATTTKNYAQKYERKRMIYINKLKTIVNSDELGWAVKGT